VDGSQSPWRAVTRAGGLTRRQNALLELLHVPVHVRVQQVRLAGGSGAADDLDAGAVVVGAHEPAGRHLVGSVAVRLVGAGRWPVAVVP